jgi:hypothetical protein
MSHSLPLLQPTLPQPPVFDRVEDERLHRKQRCRTHHGPRSRIVRSFLGESVWYVLWAHSRL